MFILFRRELVNRGRERERKREKEMITEIFREKESWRKREA